MSGDETGHPLPPVPDPAPAQRLERERQQALASIDALSRDFAAMVQAAADVATDDEHDPDGATLAYERAQVDALLTHAHARLAGVDRALERLQAGSYGRCASCGRKIAPERLAARPVAQHCVGCATSSRTRG
ncbi:MAG: TraR/DksA C4-type zinc finger protein [Actinomycetota bacterium]